MNSSSDARIIEQDDHEISSDIDNLELARRHGYEVENSILTVTMNDEQSLEIISDHGQVAIFESIQIDFVNILIEQDFYREELIIEG